MKDGKWNLRSTTGIALIMESSVDQHSIRCPQPAIWD